MNWNEERGQREFEFLAGGPHRTAELHAIWGLDKAKFEKVDRKNYR